MALETHLFEQVLVGVATSLRTSVLESASFLGTFVLRYLNWVLWLLFLVAHLLVVTVLQRILSHVQSHSEANWNGRFKRWGRGEQQNVECPTAHTCPFLSSPALTQLFWLSSLICFLLPELELETFVAAAPLAPTAGGKTKNVAPATSPSSSFSRPSQLNKDRWSRINWSPPNPLPWVFDCTSFLCPAVFEINRMYSACWELPVCSAHTVHFEQNSMEEGGNTGAYDERSRLLSSSMPHLTPTPLFA